MHHVFFGSCRRPSCRSRLWLDIPRSFRPFLLLASPRCDSEPMKDVLPWLLGEMQRRSRAQGKQYCAVMFISPLRILHGAQLSGQLNIGFVFMDQRGSRYHTDSGHAEDSMIPKVANKSEKARHSFFH